VSEEDDGHVLHDLDASRVDVVRRGCDAYGHAMILGVRREIDKRRRLVVAMAFVACAGVAPRVSAADHYLCYKAALAKRQPKFPKGLMKPLEDQFGAAQFDVKKIVAICNPADRDGSGTAHPDVHLQGFAIKAHRPAPKFVRSDHVTQDQLAPMAPRTLTIIAPAALLDVTPKVPGSTPPAAFASDPTSDTDVNRFKCYKAKLAKGSSKFQPPPPPTVTDEFFTGGQQLVVKKVTRLCKPVDKDGETPGAASRQGALVCYAVKLPKGVKFTKTTVATNDSNFSPHVLVVSAPAELCMPAQEPTPTATLSPTPTLSATPTISPTPTPTLTPSRTPTPVATPGKRVFITSTMQNGGFGGTSGADTFCADRATAAGLAGTFKAWLSVTGDGPATRFTHATVPYGLVDGTLIANDWTDLTNGSLAHAINRDESGLLVTADVWTGTGTAGAPTALNCNNFLNATGSVFGVCGTSTVVNSSWTQASTPACNTPLHLYCFEQ
jgi:hypothetical protein